MLADTKIKQALHQGILDISPFDEAALQPASYDLTLDRHFLQPATGTTVVDVADMDDSHMSAFAVGSDGLIIEPGEFLLGCTRERVALSKSIMGRVEGKSSIGRIGLSVHITAGFIDPGFEGQITLEIVNLAPYEIIVYPGMRIAQIAFSRMDGIVHQAYGSAGNHYQGQEGPVASRYRLIPLPEAAER